MAAAHELLTVLSTAGITIEARNGILRYRPASALTPDLLAAVKGCKQDLLKILQNRSPSPKGLSAVGSSLSPNTAPGTQVHPIETLAQTQGVGEAYADREWNRFLSIAVETPDGNGLYDPINGSAEMPTGVPIEDWRRFERYFAIRGQQKRSTA